MGFFGPKIKILSNQKQNNNMYIIKLLDTPKRKFKIKMFVIQTMK